MQFPVRYIYIGWGVLLIMRIFVLGEAIAHPEKHPEARTSRISFSGMIISRIILRNRRIKWKTKNYQ
jgi:hypothetical protein